MRPEALGSLQGSSPEPAPRLGGIVAAGMRSRTDEQPAANICGTRVLGVTADGEVDDACPFAALAKSVQQANGLLGQGDADASVHRMALH